jgi:signal transduction histidine kinase
MKKSKNTLKWRFDVNTFRLLGRDLITDPITALFELVKNSYDANAENVSIQFVDIKERNRYSRIIIKDDGLGMSLDDIKNKWMVIGTASKRKDLFSPEPYKRRYIGEKGIGRFAVDKLGQYVRIRTRKKNEEKELVVIINWQTYEDLATQDQPKLFTDIENSFEFVEPSFDQGTILEIFKPRQIWTYDDVTKSTKELSRLVSPFHEAKYPFNIFIQAKDFEPFLNPIQVTNNERSFASTNFDLGFNEEEGYQEYLNFDKIEKKLVVKKKDKLDFGYIKFYLYYFDRDAKDRFNAYHKGTSVNIDGVKIYRDGILTTPFAEYEASDEKRRDVLGINKRRWRATFDRMGTRDCIGYIEITKERNPNIIDATNRQNFLETKEFSNLKDFIYEQLDAFMKIRKVEREKVNKERLSSFDVAKDLMGTLQKELKKLRSAKTEKKQDEIVHVIQNTLPEMAEGLKAVTTEYKETQKEGKRREKMYFSLMSLSLFAANISHAVRTIIYSINDDARYLENKIEDTRLKGKASRINREIQRLLKVVDFMLKYAKTDLPEEYFNVEELINNVFDAHETIFIERRIECTLDIDSNLSLYGNQIFFQDIITNLVSNSIKALEGTFQRNISCVTQSDSEEMTLIFKDNGIGVPREKREWVFEVYNTTTPNQGGAGIGLYVVKTNIEALGGSISILDTEEGASFKIIIPFKK